MTALVSLSSCCMVSLSRASVMASTNVGFILVDERPFFYLRYLDLSTTVPLMILTLGLFSGTRLVETLFLTVLSSLMFAAQLFCGLHPELNRWSTLTNYTTLLLALSHAPSYVAVVLLFAHQQPCVFGLLCFRFFFALNLLFYLPVASALSGGFRSQAEVKHGAAISARVSQLSLVVLLYTLILQLLVLLTECLHYMHHEADTITATLADLITKLAFTTAIVYSTDLITRVVDNDELLLRVLEAGERGEGYGGEETMETSVGGVKMKGGDPLHMRPEATERTSLRGKV